MPAGIDALGGLDAFLDPLVDVPNNYLWNFYVAYPRITHLVASFALGFGLDIFGYVFDSLSSNLFYNLSSFQYLPAVAPFFQNKTCMCLCLQ